MAAKFSEEGAKFYKDLHDLTTCALCFNSFQDPSTLPCLHVYCFKCIADIVYTSKTTGDKKFCCPSCRAEYDVNRIGDLPCAFMLNSLSDTIRKFHKLGLDGSTKCSECCREDTTNKWICIDCPKGMCNRCKVVHDGLLDGHSVYEYQNITREQLDKMVKSRKLQCTDHKDEELRYLCSCGKLICYTCTLTEHPEHEDEHKTKKEISKAKNEHSQKLSNAAKENAVKLDLCKKKSKEMALLEANLPFTAQKSIKVVEEAADTQVKVILKKKADIIGAIKNNMEMATDEIKTLQLTATDCVKRCERVITHIQHVLQHGTDADIINTSVTEAETKLNIDFATIADKTLSMHEINFQSGLKVDRVLGSVHFSGGVKGKLQYKKLFGFDIPFEKPSGIAVRSSGEIIICGDNNSDMRAYNSHGQEIRRFPGINKYWDVCCSGKFLYCGNQKMKLLTFMEGSKLHMSINMNMKGPYGICELGRTLYMSSRQENTIIFIQNNEIMKLNTSEMDIKAPVKLSARHGKLAVSCRDSRNVHLIDIESAADRPNSKCLLQLNSAPFGVVIDRDDNVIVANLKHNLLYFVDMEGNILSKLNVGIDGISGPTGIALDDRGHLYVSGANSKNLICYEYSF